MDPSWIFNGVSSLMSAYAVWLAARGNSKAANRTADGTAKQAEATGDAAIITAQADAKAKEEQTKVAKDNAVLDNALKVIEMQSKEIAECQEDRKELWREMRGAKGDLHQVKQDVQVLKQNGNGNH
jgi:uncharacterized protein (UPF0335 family)